MADERRGGGQACTVRGGWGKGLSGARWAGVGQACVGLALLDRDAVDKITRKRLAGAAAAGGGGAGPGVQRSGP
jgi:hypothetical protein